MVEEQYTSFEVAKLLKEKGFNESCRYYYVNNGNLMFTEEYLHNSEIKYGTYSSCVCTAPTQQMAMAWLREIHNIHIDICSIWDVIHWLYQVFVITPRTARNSYVDKILYTSYEQAVEAGIKYCLENLI